MVKPAKSRKPRQGQGSGPGPGSGQLILYLSKEQIQSLLEFLDRELETKECDHTFKNASQWAEARGLSPEELRPGFEQLGARCDCEIIVKIDPDDFI